MAIVANVLYELPELAPSAASERPKVLDLVFSPVLSNALVICSELLIYKTLYVILVCRPETLRFIPDRIERASSNH